MKSTVRSLLAILLALACMTGTIPVQAEEINYTCGENITWSLDVNTKVLTLSGTGKMFSYSSVGSNVAPWIKYSTVIETLIVEDGITYIGRDAFYGCASMEKAIIGEGVTIIGTSAFHDCRKLRTIELPSTLHEIEQQAFCCTDNLREILFPNGCNLLWVSSRLFKHSTNVNTGGWYRAQPKGCVYIGDLLFDYKGIMPENTTLHVKEGTRVIQADFRNKTNLVDLDIPDSVFSIGGGNIENQGAFDGTTWFQNQQASTQGVIYAGKVAYRFNGTMQLEHEIVLEEGTTGIAAHAFYNHQLLTKLTLPKSLVCLQRECISFCNYLTELDLSSVKYMYRYALDTVGIKHLTVPKGLLWSEIESFRVGSSMETVVFEDDAYLTVMPDRIIGDGSCVQSIQLSNTLTALYEETFYHCGALKSILIPPSVQYIERKFVVGMNIEEIKPTIQCYFGSYAHTFAIENEYPFELLDEVQINTQFLTEQLEAAKTVQRNLYTAESLETLDEAVQAVRYGAQTTQKTVDAWTAAIQKAIADLVYKPADYLSVQEQIQNAQALDRDLYTQDSLKSLDDAIAAVDWTLPIVRQADVDAFAQNIAAAVQKMVYRPADYSAVEAAVQTAQQTDRIMYTEASLLALDMAVDAVIYDLDITNQAQVNGFAEQIALAIEGLSYCSVVLRNETHGVLVSATAKEIHPETSLAVDEIDASVNEIADFAVGGHIKSVRYYDITLLRRMQIVQPFGTVEVKIRIADGVDPAKCRVYHVTGDLVDPLVRMASSLDGNYIVFHADHFSEYAVVEVETVLDRVAVAHLPNKTRYALGESLDHSGLQVTAYFSDGTQRTIDDYDLSAVEMSSIGEKTVTVYYTYNGTTKSDRFMIYVTAEAVSAQILIDGTPMQQYNRRVKWFRPYTAESVSLRCDVSAKSDVQIEWSSDNEKVQVDPSGKITNKSWFGARKATITATVKDKAGNVIANAQITVRFYKFNFQLSRLSTRDVVYIPNKIQYIFL